MGVELGQPRSFGRASPVREYWLAHCEGFRLRTGRGRRGVVEAVAFHEGSAHPQALAVRVGIFRRLKLVPVDAVDEVVPANRLLVVADERGHGGGVSRPVARAIVAAGHALSALLGGALLLLAAAARALARGSRRAGSAGGAATSEAARAVRLGSLLAARHLRAASASTARGTRRTVATLAVAAREAGARGRLGATRLQRAAGPRARATAEHAVRVTRSVNDRLEPPLLRLHRRYARVEAAEDGSARPLLPRSFRPPSRSGRPPGSPTRSTSRRSS